MAIAIDKQWMRWSLSLSLGLGCSASLQAQSACDGNGLGKLLADAQSLASSAEANGRALLSCSREDYREAALYWLGFYLHQTQQDSKFPELLKPWPQSNEKGQARLRAWSGDPQFLKTKIQTGTSGFGDDPSLMLSLARSAVRAGLFKDGHQAYEIYLQQGENRDAQEAERLYAYIWANDAKAARLQIASLKRYELTPYLKQVIERAEALLGPDKTLASPLIGAPGPWLRLSGEQGQDTYGYAWRALKADYSGFMDIGIDAYEFQHALEPSDQNQALFTVGKIFETGSWRWHASLGYFSGGDQHVTGLAQIEWYPTPVLSFGVGAKREPIAVVERPLLGDREGLMRDTAEASLGLFQRVILNAALHQDDETAQFESYRAEVRLGSLLQGEWDEGFGFFLPFAYRHRPTPSPDFISYPKEFDAGVGLRLATSDGASYRIEAEALIEQLRRSYYIDTEAYEQLLQGTLSVDSRYYATPSLYLFGSALLRLTEKNPYERENQRLSEFSIGVALRDFDTGRTAR